jgi:hypothetical protein
MLSLRPGPAMTDHMPADRVNLSNCLEEGTKPAEIKKRIEKSNSKKIEAI